METVEELVAFLRDAIGPEARGRLLARGGAWSLMREDGVLPEGAPDFGRGIDTDLAEYGFSILRAALALHETGEERGLAVTAFETAAVAFEALVRNSEPDAAERGFLRTLAASCYHLGSYSAIAFSIFAGAPQAINASPSEKIVSALVLRNLGGMRRLAREWLEDPEHADTSIADALARGDASPDEAVATILTSVVCRAMAAFDLALQSGDPALVEDARSILTTGLVIADRAANVPQWWVIRIARALIGDLWEHSLHRTLPMEPPLGETDDYAEKRSLFIASLYGRKVAEVELWPSQREAATRSTDLGDDLVVALPTSAGKTRVAEIAALMTLSTGRRVLVVTPLRALSAQTERSFRRTFGPLGWSVSSLYGASGVSEGDEDALRTRPIVIATPEKLDFALRSDPAIIDDVGLIVLDEGHLIGPGEREVRYEILVQRLLRRADAADRRLVCLSAILPEGEALDDLTSWIRSDVEGEAVRSKWRPTRQRFGTITWSGRSARLTFGLNPEAAFVGRFVEVRAAIPPERSGRPRDVKDLTLLSAWKFAEQGKRSLVFSTQANWVEGFGTRAADLVRRGYLDSLVDDLTPLARALEVGREWLGEDHDVLRAMRVGVAVHHGKLPQPFLRELELLLGSGVLRVIVASPTLSQGLNLNAAVLLVPYLVRSGEMISGEEFANVAGRAGRAFVDVEGFVAHVIHDQVEWRTEQWRQLVGRARARNLVSGLLQVTSAAIAKLAQQGVFDRDDAFEYLANSREAWRSDDEPADDDEDDGQTSLDDLVERLDAIVFGLVEALDADSEELPRLLDEALNGSLWARQVAREPEGVRESQRALILARASIVWRSTDATSRRGHFAMGVGLESGLALDAIADEVGELIDEADAASLRGDEEALGDALVALAGRLLAIRPFVPKPALHAGWEGTLRSWVSGDEVAAIGGDRMKTVEEAFAYRLVWGLEALRTRRVSMGWEPLTVAGGGAAVLETGVPQLMMSMLIRAGLPSREAAIAAIRTGGAEFADSAGMREWLRSEEVEHLTAQDDWPTARTVELWRRFRSEATGVSTATWTRAVFRQRPARGERMPAAGTYRVEIDAGSREAWLVSPDFSRVARLRGSVRDRSGGMWKAIVADGDHEVTLERIGPGQVRWRNDATA